MSISVFLVAPDGRASRHATDLRTIAAAGFPVRRINRHQLLEAAREATTSTLVLLSLQAVVDSTTLDALRRAERESRSVVGGRCRTPAGDLFGAAIAPERFGPFPFAIALLQSPPNERNVDALFVGPIDVIVGGVVMISRSLFVDLSGYDTALEEPFALADLCLRARALGATVACDPTIAFTRDAPEPTPRGPFAAMSLLASRHFPLALHHDPPGVRKRGISREVRLSGGVRTRIRKPVPPITLIVHGKPPTDVPAFLGSARSNDASIARIIWSGPDAPMHADVERGPDTFESLRAAMARRGDRYVAILAADQPVQRGWLDRLIEEVEWGSEIAMAFTSREAPAHSALLSLRQLPQHIVLPDAETLSAALVALARTLAPLRRGIRIGDESQDTPLVSIQRPATTSVIFLAGSKPEVVKSSFEALSAQTPNAHEYLVVLPAGAETTRKLLAAYPRVTIVPDAMDPSLAVGLNVALAMAVGDRILVASDEYLFPPDTAAALFAAFDRDPVLGLAAPRTNGGESPQGVQDIGYVDLIAMQRYAAERLERFARELTFVDRITTVAFVIDHRALESVGGFDERFGVNRFSVEDLALRVRATGYRTAMCEDVFLHRFNVDYSFSAIGHADADQTLWNAFRRKWSLPNQAIGTYDPSPLIEAGFDRGEHFVALRDSAQALPAVSLVTFVGTIEGEEEWGAASESLRKYFAAFSATDPVTLVLGVKRGGVELGDVAYRLRRLLTAAEIDIDSSMNVELVGFDDSAELVAALPEGRRVIAFGARQSEFAGTKRIMDRSREGLRALMEPVGVAR